MTPRQAKIFREIQKHLQMANELAGQLYESDPGCQHQDQKEITLMGDKVRKFACLSCKKIIETTVLVGPSEPVGTATWPPRSFG